MCASGCTTLREPVEGVKAQTAARLPLPTRFKEESEFVQQNVLLQDRHWNEQASRNSKCQSSEQM